MKETIETFIISIVMILILIIIGFFGKILWDEYQNIQNSDNQEAEAFESDYSEQVEKNEIKVPQIVENPFDGTEENTTKTNVSYENVTVDKYFYKQLDEYSALIYKAFESNKENMKTGTAKIELGDKFTNVLNQSNGQQLLQKYYQSAIEAYTYDNPDIFYLNPNKMYLNIETTTLGSKKTYNTYINAGSQTSYLIDEFNSKQQIEQAISSLENVKNQIINNKKQSTYENIKMVHDYIINNVDYDTTLSYQNIYNIYGTLVNKKAVCAGYAKTFKYLMDSLEIPCISVIGKATNSEGRTENHEWNYVQINQKWYAIDTTWDDPVSTTGYVSNKSKYKYFLKGATEMAKDHTASNQFSDGGKIFNYPELSESNYSK